MYDLAWKRAIAQPIEEPPDWGYFEDKRLVKDYYWRRRASGYTLTLTGSYMKDRELYPLLLMDVDLYGALMEIQESEVEKFTEASKPKPGNS
jgi:hypothetical protein